MDITRKAFSILRKVVGHHMTELGNHPILEKPILLHLKFEEFDNAVVICGNYTFRDIIAFPKKVGYINADTLSMEVIAIGKSLPNSYKVSFSDDIMKLALSDFVNKVREYTVKNWVIKRKHTLTRYLEFVKSFI